MLARLRAAGAKRAVVSTGEHPFFAPARAMYERAGFVEVRRFEGGPAPRYLMIEYELMLSVEGD